MRESNGSVCNINGCLFVRWFCLVVVWNCGYENQSRTESRLRKINSLTSGKKRGKRRGEGEKKGRAISREKGAPKGCAPRRRRAERDGGE